MEVIDFTYIVFPTFLLHCVVPNVLQHRSISKAKTILHLLFILLN